jgi:hypothetical protein
MATWRSLGVPVAILLLTGAATYGLSGTASAEPPNVPSESTAREFLADLKVAPDGSMDGYDREKFPHWSTVSGSCNTREEVLKRDGENVETNSSCTAVKGTWFSPYDGETWTAATDVDIDHIVPLANAWRTGADEWTTDKREEFANDLTDAQLIAVTDNVNQEKGDQSPDTWKPPLESYWCTYAEMWIASKHKWELTINEAEKSALEDMLNTC